MPGRPQKESRECAGFTQQRLILITPFFALYTAPALSPSTQTKQQHLDSNMAPTSSAGYVFAEHMMWWNPGHIQVGFSSTCGSWVGGQQQHTTAPVHGHAALVCPPPLTPPLPLPTHAANNHTGRAGRAAADRSLRGCGDQAPAEQPHPRVGPDRPPDAREGPPRHKGRAAPGAHRRARGEHPGAPYACVCPVSAVPHVTWQC